MKRLKGDGGQPACPNCGGLHFGTRFDNCPFIKALCVICEAPTIYACSDCRIDTGFSVHVCEKVSCQREPQTSSGAEAQLGEGERGLSQPSSRQGPFSPEVELRNLCAEMYQIAGVLEAPAKVLDQLSAGAQGKKLPHSTLLPFICKGETQQ